jgi:hypothetical protein
VIVCDWCGDHDILLEYDNPSNGEWWQLCTLCTLEAHLKGVLTDECYEELAHFPYEIRKEKFVEDLRENLSDYTKENIDEFLKKWEE